MGFRYSYSLIIIWSTVICTALTGAQSTEPPMSGDDHCHDPTEPGHVHPTEDTAGHSMHMYFHFNEVCILFQNWHPSSTGAWIVSCLIVCICALLYEGLKESRQILMRRKATPDKSTSDVNGGDSEMSWTQRMFNSSHVIQTCLHFVQLTLSYSLMLVAMTFNVWLFLSVVLGLAIGYYLFSWPKATTSSCHEKNDQEQNEMGTIKPNPAYRENE